MKQRRKKLLSLLLVPTLAVSLTACGASTKTEDAKNAVAEKAEEVKDAAKDAAADAKDAAEDAADAAKDAVEDAADAAKDAAEDVKDAAEDAADAAKDAAEDAADAAKDAVEGAADAAKDAVEDAKDTAEAAVEDAKDAVAEVAANADDPYAANADDPYAANADDPYAANADDPYAANADDPYAAQDTAANADDPYAENADDPYAANADDPYAANADDPYAAQDTAANADDPYAANADDPYAANADDPYAAKDTAANSDDPYAANADDPYAANADDPYAANSDDPYAANSDDPYAANADDPYAANADDPYAANSDDPYAANSDDPYAANSDDPYAANSDDPYAANSDDPYAANSDDPYAANSDDPYAANSDDPYAAAETTEDAAEETKAEETAVDDSLYAANAATEDGKYVPTPSEDAKYTVEVTADDWVKIVNEDGETLGLSQTSGVKILEQDGYAFKDMNQNGELDVYEDWRADKAERIQNLVDQMQGKEEAAILAHGGWSGAFTTEPLAEDDASRAYLNAGGRGGVTRRIGEGGEAHAKWTNQIQAVAEETFYAIPAMISIDPANISNIAECVQLGATMDTELAAEVGQRTAKEFRAAGVTALLGPQVDIASPVMNRAGGTYGEDPQLTRDIATAYVNGLQSTYDENGEDLGWGKDSVYCFTKHFAGAGSTEAGRDDHANIGRYAIFPGDNFEAHLIAYFDGVFALPGKTGSSGTMTQYAIDVDGNGDTVYGGELAGAYNSYLNNMLDEAGYDSLKITDWGVFSFAGWWGTEDMESVAHRIAFAWEQGMNLLGGHGDMEAVAQAYDILVENVGQDKADELMDKAAGRYIKVMMELGMFENPYNDSAAAAELVNGEEAMAFGQATQDKALVMIKNDGTIKEGGNGVEKPTVYVPYVYNTGFSVSWMAGISAGTPSWAPGLNLDVLGQYFNIVTDTVAEPTGEEVTDQDGNTSKLYTDKDIVRASAEDIAKCDYVLVGMSNAYSQSYDAQMTRCAWGAPIESEVADEDEKWFPVSLQYAEYTAETAAEKSVSGKVLEDGTRENRSFKGNTAPAAANYGELEALQYAKENAGEVPVIVSMNMSRGMVWSEVEPLANAILVSYNRTGGEEATTTAIAKAVLGQLEPTGLLVFQQPASMEAVEAQVSDVPRDMECYVDAAGNTYDFAFGMNWAGVISDERTEKYSAAPLADLVNFDYKAYAEKYKGTYGIELAADAAADAAEAVEEKAEEVAEAAEEKVEEAADAVEAAAETAADAVEDAADAVEEAAEDAADAVEEAVEDAAETVKK